MPAANPHAYKAESPDTPARRLEAITPHDVNELAYVTRGLYVGTAGNVSVVDVTGNTVTIPNVPAGAILPICIKQVRLTGTTASNMVGLS